MLPKKNRASTQEVEQIFKGGKFLNSASLTFKYIKSIDPRVRISFIAPKSVARLATKRNFLRRVGYTALAQYLNKFPPRTVGVFIFRKYQDNVSIISDEIKNLLSKIN